jgi:hypothetical protein
MSTISTSGISPNQVIRAEHVLRVINALSNTANNDILITGSLTVTGSTALSGSLNVTGGITGSVFGTSSNATSASYAVNARNATSASYALTASYAVSASFEINYETSSSYADNATSASYATVAQTLLGSVVSASYALSSSNAASATSASYTTVAQTLLGSVVSASYALSSSYSLNSTNAANATLANFATNAGYAATAGDADTLDGLQATSFVRNSQTSSMTVNSASFAINASSSLYALTASYALNSPGGGGTTNTGSLLLTASATNNVITFTKGDASTFNITVNTGSASSINTGSFATTGSNTFRGNQTITGSVSISGSQSITGSLSVNSGTIINSDAFSIMSVYPNIITIENQGSPFDYTLLSLGVLSYNSSSNAQQLLFPASLSTGIKAITLPNDNGTVALTYNTATTGSNTFTGNQTINANLSISASRQISLIGGTTEMYITSRSVLISPNYSGADQATLSGGSLSLSKANSYSSIQLTNRNSTSSPEELSRMDFYGKSTDANFGIKAGLKVNTVGGTGSLGSFNFYTSASQGFGFTTGDLDMRISSGSSIELFRNTTITGSLNVSGSSTFGGNQTINANLILSASRTMSIVGPLAETYVTEGQVSISPNYSGVDQAVLSGGNLSLSKANGTSTIVLTNRNSPATLGNHLTSITFNGKSTDDNLGLKGGIRATTVGGTGANMSLNLFTSASGGFGTFNAGDLDMRISSGSKIELFRNTTITGSVSITSVLTLTPNDPLPTSQPTGSISVSGSGADCKPYFYNGTTWTSLI